jgi:adenylate cyclase
MRFEYSQAGEPTQVFDQPLDSVTIGRPAADLVIDLDLTPDTQVSRPHARLSRHDGDCWIEDLGSKHGTFVNSRRISRPTRLTEHDTVTIGRTTIRFSADGTGFKGAPESGTTEGTAFKDAPAPDTAAAQPAPQPEPVPRSVKIDARRPPFEPPPQATIALAEQARRQLQQFYHLSQALGATTSVDELLHRFTTQLRQTFPQAHRGAVLLLDEQGGLLLKEHWPPGRPSVSMSWAQRVCEERAAFFWSDQQSIDPSRSARAHGVRSTIYAPLLWREEVLGVVYVDNAEQPDAFQESDLDLLRAFADQCALHLKNQLLQQDLRRETAARRDLLRQFPPALAERMLHEQSYPRLSGEQISPVTVLVSDVRGFTALSATMESNDVVRMLNEMFSTLTPIIFRQQGIVDKYIGDGLLAVFGSPDPDPQQGEHAIRAAWEMQAAMRDLARRRQQRGLAACEIGIGIHCGTVVHGFIGSPERMEYTVIGDTVNRAARHCDGASRGRILISRTVYERVFKLVEVTPTSIKTKHPDREPDLTAYIVTGLKTEEGL